MLASGQALSAPGPKVGSLGWTLWGFCLSAVAAAQGPTVHLGQKELPPRDPTNTKMVGSK